MTQQGIELPGVDLLDRLNEHMDVGLEPLGGSGLLVVFLLDCSDVDALTFTAADRLFSLADTRTLMDLVRGTDDIAANGVLGVHCHSRLSDDWHPPTRRRTRLDCRIKDRIDRRTLTWTRAVACVDRFTVSALDQVAGSVDLLVNADACSRVQNGLL